MQLHAPLRTVTSAVDGDVLAVLARAEADFTVPDLTRLIVTRSSEGIRRALDRLVEQGVVHHFRVGRSSAYRLNRHHLAARAIIELSSLTSTLRERISQDIEQWPELPLYAALFGSAARGEMAVQSDIDLAIVSRGAITEAWEERVASLEEHISLWTGNDCRTLRLVDRDIEDRRSHERVLDDIAREGIRVAGNRDEFLTLIGSA